jgi:seryl-tRNA synthetase
MDSLTVRTKRDIVRPKCDRWAEGLRANCGLSAYGMTRYALTSWIPLNNTVVASPRILIPILENYQNADGSVTIPEALRPHLNGRERIG